VTRRFSAATQKNICVLRLLSFQGEEWPCPKDLVSGKKSETPLPIIRRQAQVQPIRLTYDRRNKSGPL
jgi:hypothetical protein